MIVSTEIREACLIWYGNNCDLCKRAATAIHHLHYDFDLSSFEEEIKLVRPLCNACHLFLHFDGNGNFRDQKDSFNIYNNIKSLEGAIAKEIVEKGRIASTRAVKRLK